MSYAIIIPMTFKKLKTVMLKFITTILTLCFSALIFANNLSCNDVSHFNIVSAQLNACTVEIEKPFIAANNTQICETRTDAIESIPMYCLFNGSAENMACYLAETSPNSTEFFCDNSEGHNICCYYQNNQTFCRSEFSHATQAQCNQST